MNKEKKNKVLVSGFGMSKTITLTFLTFLKPLLKVDGCNFKTTTFAFCFSTKRWISHFPTKSRKLIMNGHRIFISFVILIINSLKSIF